MKTRTIAMNKRDKAECPEERHWKKKGRGEEAYM